MRFVLAAGTLGVVALFVAVYFFYFVGARAVDGDADNKAAEGATAPPAQQNLQKVLVASVVGAIILMIAIAAFWTSLGKA